jgi:hypothetical protein
LAVSKLDDQLGKLAETIGVSWGGPYPQEKGFFFTTPELCKRNLRISFAFDEEENEAYKGFYFGFECLNPEEKCPVAAEIYSQFERQFKGFELDKQSIWFPASAWWKGQDINWGHETFESICSGKFANEELKPILEQLAGIAHRVCRG